MNKILYKLIFVFAFLLIGCTSVDNIDNISELKDNNEGVNLAEGRELPNDQEPNEPVIKDSKLNDPKNEDKEKEEEGIELEYSFDFMSKTFIQRNFDGVLLINTYEEYLKAIDDGHITIGRLDKEHFDTMGLVIYGKWEGSGSIKVSFKSLVLNKEGTLLFNVKRYVPEIGTDDMRYHGAVIDFMKPDEEIRDINLVYYNTNVTRKDFNISSNDDSRKNVDKFIEEQDEKIVYAYVTLWFKEGRKNTSKYDFSKIGGYFSELNALSFSMISFNNPKDINLDALYEIAYDDDFDYINLAFSYEVTHIVRDPVFK